jgi:voltage-gated potassium channel
MSNKRFETFVGEILRQTPFLLMIALLVILWLAFSSALYFSERAVESSPISSLGTALYWGVAALSTAGIADTPVSGISKIIGATWIIVGSMLFFGIIVGTVTAYFMRPLQRPSNQIVDSIEYNLEQLDQLSVDELDLLKETVDTLIEHVERIKNQRQPAETGA